MKIRNNVPPRVYEAGFPEHRVKLSDCAHIELAADEQVTFETAGGGEYDVTRKNWGFYATPSINGRLARFGFRTVLVRNRQEQVFVLLVERGHEKAFEEYLDLEKLVTICWLDDPVALARLKGLLNAEE